MPHKRIQLPRLRQPELEREIARIPALGYEPRETAGVIRFLSHGFPTPLARWHCHDEFELHLIVASSGKAFVGDYIGNFQPGHLVLTGPRLPHNWLSVDLPLGGYAERDLVVQFSQEPIELMAQNVPEMQAILPLLERSKHGIEFFGISEQVTHYMQKIRASSGLERFGIFCQVLGELARCNNYQLLSTAQLQSIDSSKQLAQIDAIVSRVTGNLTLAVSAADLAAELEMTESRFSRFFRRSTGNTFTDFVNQIRITRACQLLMESDRQVAHICYEVGFNNIANFNRRFLDIKGMTPSEFRKQMSNRFGTRH